MAATLVASPRPAAQASSRPSTQRDQLPESKLWLNIGVETEDQGFVPLPRGLAIDTMQKFGGRNPSEDAARRNRLLDMILEFAAESLQPGETKMLDLKVQIRRVDDTPRAKDPSALPSIGSLVVR